MMYSSSVLIFFFFVQHWEKPTEIEDATYLLMKQNKQNQTYRKKVTEPKTSAFVLNGMSKNHKTNFMKCCGNVIIKKNLQKKTKCITVGTV